MAKKKVLQNDAKSVEVPRIEFEWVPVTEIIPNARNPREHDEANVNDIAASIREYGPLIPILIDDKNTVIAGHGRLLAAQKLGMTEFPCVREKHLTATQRKAYMIADNQYAARSKWNMQQLGLNMIELKEVKFDLTLTGFDQKEANDAIKNSGNTSERDEREDDAPPVEDTKPPVCQHGEIWLLGEHRLMCGDSTSETDVEKLMVGVKADAVLTDPPYGINQPGIPNDEPEKLESIVKGAVAALPISAHCAIIVAFQSTRTFPQWLDVTRSAGAKFERMLWLYKEAQNSYPWRGWLLTSEAILISSMGTAAWNDYHPYHHDCYKVSEVSGEIPANVGWHGSVKPQSVLQDLCNRIAKDGQIIFDCFLGSGSTLIACEKTNRRCFGMEISPHYCDVIIKRWQDYSGKKAVRERDGTVFG